MSKTPAEFSGKNPAFMSYAYIDIFTSDAHGLGLFEIGLLHRIRCSQFTGFPLSADPNRLARVLNEDVEKLGSALEALGVEEVDDDEDIKALAKRKGGPLLVSAGGLLLCPDTERQCERHAWNQRQKSEGGKKGAAIREANKAARAGGNEPPF